MTNYCVNNEELFTAFHVITFAFFPFQKALKTSLKKNHKNKKLSIRNFINYASTAIRIVDFYAWKFFKFLMFDTLPQDTFWRSKTLRFHTFYLPQINFSHKKSFLKSSRDFYYWHDKMTNWNKLVSVCRTWERVNYMLHNKARSQGVSTSRSGFFYENCGSFQRFLKFLYGNPPNPGYAPVHNHWI